MAKWDIQVLQHIQKQWCESQGKIVIGFVNEDLGLKNIKGYKENNLQNFSKQIKF